MPQALLRFFLLLAVLILPIFFFYKEDNQFFIMLGITIGVTLAYWIGYAIIRKRKP